MTVRSVLMTGTDTGVGKTFVGCGLAAALTARGRRVLSGVGILRDKKHVRYFSQCVI